MTRVTIQGKGQAFEGDVTTTGATCISGSTIYRTDRRLALLLGDTTSECPVCGQKGVIAEGVPFYTIEGRQAVVDGALVECGCPSGSNRVVAQAAGHAASVRPAQTVPSASSRHSPASHDSAFTPLHTAFVQDSSSLVEPGFHIVQRSMSFKQVLESLGATHSPLPASLLQRLNPTYAQGFKAGEIFVLGSPSSGFSCGMLETELMMVADRARQSLAILSDEEANFMMQHVGEIAGVLNGASQSMGVGKDMLERGLGQVKDTLKGIEALHQRQFAVHGHLKNPEFFAARKALYKKLDAQLRIAFLNKPLNLGSYDRLRRDLGISTKSVVHHWKKAGVPGQIPGYATHLDDVARMSKYLKYGGAIGIGLGAGSSYLKVYEACRAGETEQCKKIRFTETGSFTGGLAGGAAGGAIGKAAAAAVCKFGVWGKAACGIVTVGASAFGGSKSMETLGEYVGAQLYEALYD